MRHFISILIALLAAGAVFAEPVAIRFSFWGNEMRFDAIEQAVSLYERGNPDVRIILDEGSYSDSRQSLQIMMTEGSMPDIVAYDYKWTGEIDDRLFVDLRSLDSLNFSDIPVEIIKDFSILDGRLIGMPLGLNGLGLVYNRSFFEKFALSDQDLWDWDDIIENGRKVHEADPESYLLFFPDSQWHYIFRTYILQRSGHHILDEDGSIGCTIEDLEAAFSFILSLIDSGTIPPFGQSTRFENWLPQWNEMWRRGKWGMTTASSSTIPDIGLASPFPIGTASFPVPDDAVDSGVYAAPTMLLAISRGSQHKEEAAAFIDFLINDPEASLIISDSCGMPANSRNRVQDSSDLVYPMVIAALEDSADELYPSETGDELLEVISEYIHIIGFGILSPLEAAHDMMARIGSIGR